VRVLAISGSLRDDSYNTKLLRTAAELLPPGVELEIWEGLKAVPPYDPGDDGHLAPDDAQALRDAIAGADALLIATPEYNHSIPGQLKNALDWVSRPAAESPMRGKPVAVVGASTGSFGAVWAQAELRKVLTALGGRVLDYELPVPYAHESFDPDGGLRDPDLAAALDDVTAALVAEAMPALVAA
jgi:chromate reductase, NAD(P)H dehydrogenase (quinone)